MISISANPFSSGGVRGIVELEVLKAIEKALGGNLSIQAFFDLIVGTRYLKSAPVMANLLIYFSTGGIIALGLGVENWSVEQCIGKFTSLCGDAFTPREFLNVPLLGKLSTVNHRSMYKTKPFEKALQESFEDRPLFGGLNSQEGHMIKVAVTSTTLMDQQPVVLANYNRPDLQGYSKIDSFLEPKFYLHLLRKLHF
jgi:patatin-like phospholipase/acyl hydrolase